MKTSHLSEKGLSITRASVISNWCNQKRLEYKTLFESYTNTSKSLTYDGETLQLTRPNSIPSNIEELVLKQCKYNACQAFLMENISAKDALLKEVQSMSADTSHLSSPIPPIEEKVVLLPKVDEDWGWSQLSKEEIAEFLENQAYAANIGQFIHNNSPIAKLREALPKTQLIEWEELETGKKTPVRVELHHTPEYLFSLHEKFAKLHYEYEGKVNYFKAKVRNLLTMENARIAGINNTNTIKVQARNKALRLQYEEELKSYLEKVEECKVEFEIWRQAEIKRIAALRISVDPLFQETIDEFLNEVGEEQS